MCHTKRMTLFENSVHFQFCSHECSYVLKSILSQSVRRCGVVFCGSYISGACAHVQFVLVCLEDIVWGSWQLQDFGAVDVFNCL